MRVFEMTENGLEEVTGGDPLGRLIEAMERAFGPMVPPAGVEPAPLKGPDFETGASTSSAKEAYEVEDGRYQDKWPEDKAAPRPEEPTDWCYNWPEEPPRVDIPTQTGLFQRVPGATGLLSFALRSAFATRLRGIFWDLHIGNYWTVQFRYDSRGYWYAQIADDNATDNMTGLPTSWSGRKWLISEYMTDGEIVQTVFKAYMTALEHEGRETFYYKGATIFDPHYDLDRLVEARTAKGALKERDGGDKLNG